MFSWENGFWYYDWLFYKPHACMRTAADRRWVSHYQRAETSKSRPARTAAALLDVETSNGFITSLRHVLLCSCYLFSQPSSFCSHLSKGGSGQRRPALDLRVWERWASCCTPQLQLTARPRLALWRGHGQTVVPELCCPCPCHCSLRAGVVVIFTPRVLAVLSIVSV